MGRLNPNVIDGQDWPVVTIGELGLVVREPSRELVDDKVLREVARGVAQHSLCIANFLVLRVEDRNEVLHENLASEWWPGLLLVVLELQQCGLGSAVICDRVGFIWFSEDL